MEIKIEQYGDGFAVIVDSVKYYFDQEDTVEGLKIAFAQATGFTVEPEYEEVT